MAGLHPKSAAPALIMNNPDPQKAGLFGQPPTRPAFFYGWKIVGVAFFAYFMAGGTGFYAFNALLEPICSLRGWSRTDLNLALVIGTLFSFICQFFYGTLLMKTGVRVLMLAGSFASGIGFMLMVRVEHLWQFYACYALMYMGNGAYGGIVASTAVNNWFIRKRGTALGLATAGISFSGAILPMAAMAMILSYGLNRTALCLGFLIMCVGPLAWMVIRNWPEEMGLAPDGDFDASPLFIPPKTALPPSPAGTKAYSSQWRVASLVRSGAFWKLGLSFGMLMIGTVGVMSQLKPRFSDMGFSHMSAMGLMALTALIGTAGKFTWGLLCDRFDPRRVVTIMAFANALGLSLVLIKNSMAALSAFIFVYGFAMGGIMAVYPVMVASLFGRHGFPAVFRLSSLFLVLQMAGYIIAGTSYDRLGNYDMAYMVFIFLDLAAAGMLFTLAAPER